MADERLERRLAAVLAADVAGYSRLMGRDEKRTLADLKSSRKALVDRAIAAHRGRIVKTTGDGLLVEFASVVDAVDCAVKIQRGMAAKNADVPRDLRIEFRIGIHVGDIIIDDNDIFGDGVNIAARLEGIAEPGGICISRQVYDQIEGKLSQTCRPLGAQNLKNISKSVEAYSVDFNAAEIAGPTEPGNMKLKIDYCRAPDGVRLAYATVGSGPPLVKTANWMNHVEYDWESSALGHVFMTLARDFTLLRYDARGNGLSDWDVEDLSLDAWVSDLETVVDAAGLDRFPLFGMSQGCAISVAFAVRHPERVSHLVLYGGFARGAYRRGNELEVQKARALATLIRTGWGEELPYIVSFSRRCSCREGRRSSFKNLPSGNARRPRPNALTAISRRPGTWTCASCCPRSRRLPLSCTSATTRYNRSRPVASSPPQFPAHGSWHCQGRTTSRWSKTRKRLACSKRSDCS